MSDLPYAKGVSFQRLKQCLPGTREGVLEEITRWMDDPSPDATRLMILTGTSGTGKSTIAHTIAHRYDQIGRLASSIFADLLIPSLGTSYRAWFFQQSLEIWPILILTINGDFGT